MKLPDIKGLETFAGLWFHTAQWPADLDLAGQRVAIIGNGASAMQIGPEIQHAPASLTIFQRSPHWVAPFEQFRKPVPDAMRVSLREVPLYQSWYRVHLGWTFNDRVHTAIHKDPSWPHPDRSLNAISDGHREYFTRYILSELGERTGQWFVGKAEQHNAVRNRHRLHQCPVPASRPGGSGLHHPAVHDRVVRKSTTVRYHRSRCSRPGS